VDFTKVVTDGWEDIFLLHGKTKVKEKNNGTMKRDKLMKTTANRRIYHILRVVDDDPYPELYGEYQKHNRGYRGYWKSKLIWQHQVRMYRTWKHNRKTKWKI